MDALSHEHQLKMGLRARPSVHWHDLQHRLLTDFGFGDRDEELVKYKVNQDDLLKVRLSASSSGCAASCTGLSARRPCVPWP
jgi:hypothetical protein